MKSPETTSALAARAHRRLAHWVEAARRVPTLRRRAPARAGWHVEVAIVGAAAMARLNRGYRGKTHATDVLSFVAPAEFYRRGVLGELVVCAPTLRRQARAIGHSPARELDVLLVHGLLHLLGFDHEKSARDAAAQARWETRLLGGAAAGAGLITRTRR